MFEKSDKEKYMQLAFAQAKKLKIKEKYRLVQLLWIKMEM
jgi:hypothetical protein